MVITEKQCLTNESRHRRMLDRMNQILLRPRGNRPRPDWNSQTLRSMDLFGLERETFDVATEPAAFQSFLQSLLDTVHPRRSYQVLEHNTHHILDRSSRTGQTISSSRLEGQHHESNFHIIPIRFSKREDIPDDGEIEHLATEIPPQSDFGNQDMPIIITENEESISDKSAVVIPDGDTVSDFSNYSSSLGRRSLSTVARQSVKNLYSISNAGNCDSDDVVVIDKSNIVNKHEHLAARNAILKKDTLVGGANKVLGDLGPDGYYTGDNLDMPAGAAYLTVKTGAHDHEMHPTSSEEKLVNDVPNYPVYSILKTKLMKECRQIDYINGDGNCFFRALSKQLYGSERYHIVLRNLIVDLIATNKNKFCQFVDGGNVQEHVERMSQEQSWATTCEIYAAATLLQRDIFMLTPDHLNEMYSWLHFKAVFKLDPEQSNIKSHPCYITLCNTNGNHYDRIVAEHGGCNCFLPHPELEGVSYSVDLTC